VNWIALRLLTSPVGSLIPRPRSIPSAKGIVRCNDAVLPSCPAFRACEIAQVNSNIGTQCPADYCDLPGIADGVSGRGLPIERFEPPSESIEDAKRIVAAAGMDLGGVEYLVNARNGLPYFYDVNALSNFVANAPEVIGFDPFVDLVDGPFKVGADEPAGAGSPRPPNQAVIPCGLTRC
jgi:hypothetical protein